MPGEESTEERRHVRSLIHRFSTEVEIMYVLRWKTVRNALDRARGLVKVLEAQLWKAPSPEGLEDWQPGTEVRCPFVAESYFDGTARQEGQFHLGSWESYHVLEGELRMAVKRFAKDAWHLLVLRQGDEVWLQPGDWHLVEEGGTHFTKVTQVPPANGKEYFPAEEVQKAQALFVAKI